MNQDSLLLGKLFHLNMEVAMLRSQLKTLQMESARTIGLLLYVSGGKIKIPYSALENSYHNFFIQQEDNKIDGFVEFRVHAAFDEGDRPGSNASRH